MMRLEWLHGIGDDYADKFKEVARAIVVNENRSVGKLDIEELVTYAAKDIAMGSLLKRNEHIVTGIGIGMIGTALAFGVGNKIIQHRTTKKEVVYYDAENNKLRKEKVDVETGYNETSAASEDIMDKVNDILKREYDLEELKAIIKEIDANEK